MNVDRISGTPYETGQFAWHYPVIIIAGRYFRLKKVYLYSACRIKQSKINTGLESINDNARTKFSIIKILFFKIHNYTNENSGQAY